MSQKTNFSTEPFKKSIIMFELKSQTKFYAMPKDMQNWKFIAKPVQLMNSLGCEV